MIVGIDGNEANISTRVGVNIYAFELLWGLYKLQDREKVKDRFIIYLKNSPNSDLPAPKEGWDYKIIPGKRLWTVTKLTPRILFSEKLDIFFSPTHYLPFFSRSPKVMVIHDLGYLNFSEHFRKIDFWQLKYWSAISIIISKYIICPSHSTEKDIVRHYPFASEKIKVIYHGVKIEKFEKRIQEKFVRQALKKYRISKNYLIFVSTLKPSKNVEGLLEAFKLFKEKWLRDELKLVIVGKRGWMYSNIFVKTKKLGLEEDVIFTDYIPEREKTILILGAKAFLLPSFWEGFGMDAVNAMALGVPVVVSKVGSLPEVVGDAGIFVDPYKIESIALGIKKAVEVTPRQREEIIKKGLKQAQKFSWEKAARETFNLFKKATSES